MKVLLLLVLASSLSMAEMLERTQMLMGTFATITLPQESSKEQQKSFAILRSVEGSLSSYDPKADVYRLNHAREVSITGFFLFESLLGHEY